MTDRPPYGMHWGIKASFLEYIGRMPDGRGSASHGATALDANIMVFEPAPEVEQPEPGDADKFWAFRGDVRFAGHHNMLYVRLADPWIVVRDGQAEMTVLDPLDPDKAPRLRLVHLTLVPQRLGEDVDAWLATDVQLTEQGTGLFNDVYPPGELFEPLAIFLPARVPIS